MLPYKVRYIWRGRTVIHITLDEPLSAKDGHVFQDELRRDAPGAKIDSEKHQEFSLEVSGDRVQEVYDRLRATYKPRLKHNVVICQAVVEGGPRDRKSFVGFILLDEFSKEERGIQQNLQGACRRWHPQAYETDDRALVAVTLGKDPEPGAIYTALPSALVRHSVGVVLWHPIAQPAALHSFVSIMRAIRAMAR